MSITIFYSLILIFQIIMLIKMIKKTNKKNWLFLLSTIITSIVSVVAFCLYFIIKREYLDSKFIIYLIVNTFAISAYALMLLISIIIRLIKNKALKSENNEIEKKTIKKSLLIHILTIFMIFLIALFFEDLPCKIKQRNDRIAAEKAREQIIVLLNQRYGDGDFEIVEMVEKNICEHCFFLGPVDGFEFTMSTSYLTDNFTVSLEKEDLKIFEDNFLNEYYKEKLGITELDGYIINYKVKKITDIITQKFNVEINFNAGISDYDDYKDKDYGQVPTIDELSNFVNLNDPKIEIKEDLKTKDDLLDYLVKFLKYLINDLDASDISYSENGKLFIRYKYDYTKLGINDYTDSYDGYGGYISEHDNTIRIYILHTDVTLNIEDILKD